MAGLQSLWLLSSLVPWLRRLLMAYGGWPKQAKAYTETRQESLANAKVSARQRWYIWRNLLHRPPLRNSQLYQCNIYIVKKYFQCSTIPSLTMRVYLHWFSRCCLPNKQTSAKFREKLNVQQFKVIQGQWFRYQSKAHMRVPISD